MHPFFVSNDQNFFIGIQSLHLFFFFFHVSFFLFSGCSLLFHFIPFSSSLFSLDPSFLLIFLFDFFSLILSLNLFLSNCHSSSSDSVYFSMTFFPLRPPREPANKEKSYSTILRTLKVRR